MFTTAWAVTLHFEHDVRCWSDYSQLNFYYIITIPFVLALVVSDLVFIHLTCSAYACNFFERLDIISWFQSMDTIIKVSKQRHFEHTQYSTNTSYWFIIDYSGIKAFLRRITYVLHVTRTNCHNNTVPGFPNRFNGSLLSRTSPLPVESWIYLNDIKTCKAVPSK